MVWLSTIGVAIYENGVAIYEWCGYLRMVWLSTKKVWLFHLAFLGLPVGAKNMRPTKHKLAYFFVTRLTNKKSGLVLVIIKLRFGSY